MISLWTRFFVWEQEGERARRRKKKLFHSVPWKWKKRKEKNKLLKINFQQWSIKNREISSWHLIFLNVQLKTIQPSQLKVNIRSITTMYSSSIILNLLKKEKKTKHDSLEDWENSSSREFPVIKITNINRATIRFLEPRWPAVSRKRIFRSSQLQPARSTSKSDGWSIFFTAGHHPISSVAVEDDARSTSGPLYLNIVEDRRREDGRAASLMCEPLIAARSSRWSSSSSSRGGRVTSKVIERWARAERRGVVSILSGLWTGQSRFKCTTRAKIFSRGGLKTSARCRNGLPLCAVRQLSERYDVRLFLSSADPTTDRPQRSIRHSQGGMSSWYPVSFVLVSISWEKKKKIKNQFLMGDCKLVEYRV